MTTTSTPTKKYSLFKDELFYIGLGILFVGVVWFFYPKILGWFDSQPQPSQQIVIPYQIDAMLKTEPEPSESIEEEKTKFQKVGDMYGTYGDSYGSLNTLFSGLAFAILIASLFLQRKELQAQRIELEEQRKEIKESNKIADGQRAITNQQKDLIAKQIHDAKVQNFYTLLFKFLEEKHRKVDEMNARLSSNLFGDTQFDRFIHYVEDSFRESIDTVNFNDPELELAMIDNYIRDAVEFANESTNHAIPNSEYFEYLCFILNFIQSHKNLGIEKDAIKVFISYQSFKESYTMFLFAEYQNDQELISYISQYSLLRKLNTYPTENLTLLRLAYFLIGDNAYSPL